MAPLSLKTLVCAVIWNLPRRKFPFFLSSLFVFGVSFERRGLCRYEDRNVPRAEISEGLEIAIRRETTRGGDGSGDIYEQVSGWKHVKTENY